MELGSENTECEVTKTNQNSDPDDRIYEKMNYWGTDSDWKSEWVLAEAEESPWSFRCAVNVASDRFELKQKLGSGRFGETFVASVCDGNISRIFNSDFVAIKILPRLSDSRKQEAKRLLEDQVHQFIDGIPEFCFPRLITEIDNKIALIYQLLTSSLAAEISSSSKKSLDVDGIIRFGKQICRSLASVHSYGQLALNLKPSSCLVDKKGEVHIDAHGLPAVLWDNYGEDTVSHLPPENRKMFLGDPKMMSSEQWEVSWKGPLCEGTDSWGFACTFIELATGNSPFPSQSLSSQYKSVVLDPLSLEKYTKVLYLFPPSIQLILRSCFHANPLQRPSIKRILKVLSNPNEMFSKGEIVVLKLGEKEKKCPNCPQLGLINSPWPRITTRFSESEKHEVEEEKEGKFDDWGEGLVEIMTAGDSKILNFNVSEISSVVEDQLEVGDFVRFRKDCRCGFRGNEKVSESSANSRPDSEPFRIRTPEPEFQVVSVATSSLQVVLRPMNERSGENEDEKGNFLEIEMGHLERTAGGLGLGDWVLIPPEIPQNSPIIGRIFRVNKNQSLDVASPRNCLLIKGLRPKEKEVFGILGFKEGEMVQPIGEQPFWWPSEKENFSLPAGGRILEIASNGLLTVTFPGKENEGKSYFVDPGSVTCAILKEGVKSGLGQAVEIWRKVESFHWSLGPFLRLLSVLVGIRLGRAVVGGFMEGNGGKKKSTGEVEERKNMQDSFLMNRRKKPGKVHVRDILLWKSSLKKG